MFFTRLLQILFGYISFRADGGNPEKFLNLSARAGVPIWNLRREGTALCARTLRSNYKKLQPQARKAGVLLCVTEEKGIPIIFERHRGRWGFLAGAVFFFAIIAYFSGFVWSVEITGNKSVPMREIRYTLSELGLTPGIRTDSLNMKAVEQKALVKLRGLSWMHINLDGSVAQVLVGERTHQPEIVPDDRPCNIKASASGQIISMKVYKGVAAFKKHDAVQKGELLVSGVVTEPKTGITSYLHADARVIARTRHTLSVTVKYKTTEPIDTGKIINKFRFNFMSLRIPFYFSEPHGSYRRMVYKSPLRVFGNELPVSVTTSAFHEYKKTPVTLTRQQALKKAKKLIVQNENTEFSGASIKNKSYTAKADVNALTLTGNYVCEEDICVSQEITVEQELKNS